MPSLDEIRTTILTSAVPDWTKISAPFFEHRLGAVSSFNNGAEEHWLDHSTHDYLLVYRPDVRLRLAVGLATNDSREWEPDWAHFPPRVVDAEHVDTFWNGALVDRNVVIAVDGSRAVLPDPRAYYVHKGDFMDYETIGNTVTQSQVSFARLLDQLEGRKEFDHYLNATGFIVVPDELS